MKSLHRLVGGLCAAALCALALTGVASSSAAAAGTTVSTVPASYTPYLVSTQSTVWKIAQCGSTMYAVGKFTQVRQPKMAIQNHTNVFAFDASTGAISSWDPQVTGNVVQSIAFSGDCSVVYLGGNIKSVGGTAVSNLAAVSASTGALITTFKHATSAQVNTLLMLSNGQLLVGGVFKTVNSQPRAALASVSATTGVPTTYANLSISGTYSSSFATQIYNLVPNADGSRILANGVFTSVGGQSRQQVMVLDAGATSLTLDGWNAPALNATCTQSELFYAKGIGWSPDSSKIYLATTGFKGVSTLCDSAVAYSSTPTTQSSFRWQNKTGCDSLYSVVADDANVYVGGHMRWLNNPNGCNAAGPGAVARSGLGSIDPTTGQVTAWNPTRSRGHGAYGETLTSAGLWVASDNFDNSNSCGGSYHPGICFLPY